MSEHFFDLDRLRRNWTATESATEPRADRFEAVQSALDVPEAARALFTQLREQALLEFPLERDTIEAYLEQVKVALDDAVQAPSKAATDQLLERLFRFEELLEAFLVRLKNG